MMWSTLQAFMRLPLPPSDQPAVVLKHLRPLDQASQDFWDMAFANFLFSIVRSGHPETLYTNPWLLTQFMEEKEREEDEIELRALQYFQLERAADEQGEISWVHETMAY